MEDLKQLDQISYYLGQFIIESSQLIINITLIYN